MDKFGLAPIKNEGKLLCIHDPETGEKIYTNLWGEPYPQHIQDEINTLDKYKDVR